MGFLEEIFVEMFEGIEPVEFRRVMNWKKKAGSLVGSFRARQWPRYRGSKCSVNSSQYRPVDCLL